MTSLVLVCLFTNPVFSDLPLRLEKIELYPEEVARVLLADDPQVEMEDICLDLQEEQDGDLDDAWVSQGSPWRLSDV